MKACGIVAEYNPFHQGHAYHIEQVKEKLNPDVIIVVMSGNFLQRGEPAIVDKWTRTQMALSGGADLIVELPVMWSTQPADFFAEGALRILKALSIDCLSFGVEEGSQTDFLKAATFLVENDDRITRDIQAVDQMNVPYAKQMQDILLKMNPDFPLELHSPNNQLGLAYAKEIVKNGLADEITILPIQRKDSAYGDETIDQQSTIASATAIRKAMFQNVDIQTYIPRAAYAFLEEVKDQKVSWEDYFPLLKYQLTVQSEAELRTIYQMKEGLENRLKSLISETYSFEEFINKVKTKRYTRTRLQRLFTYVLLQMKTEDVHKAINDEPAIRVLGFNQKGQRYLNHQKHQIDLPLVSNVNQTTKAHVPFDILAGNIYQLGDHLIQKQDFIRKPVKFN